jgi:hypothetical protein
MRGFYLIINFYFMSALDLCVSFSGGRSSAYMLYHILHSAKFRKFKKYVVFSNTGKEDEATLKFVQKCSFNFSVPVFWVEFDLDVDLKRTFKLVNFNTASRCGEPFEKLCYLKGIPSVAVPFCSSFLKREVIRQFMRSLGVLHYYTAIGIRADEIDRISVNKDKYKLLYPLIEDNICKSDVDLFWNDMPFNLTLDKVLGNCDCCWKKSFKTLFQIAKFYPDKFLWWSDMELLYGNYVKKSAKPPFYFYRGNNSALNVVSNNLNSITKNQLNLFYNISNGCSESCEVF